MFIGHFGLALAAKPAAPRTSLGTLGAAAQWVDLVWPVLLLAGIERVRVDPGNTAFTPRLSMWLLVAWMAWADRHREPR